MGCFYAQSLDSHWNMIFHIKRSLYSLCNRAISYRSNTILDKILIGIGTELKYWRSSFSSEDHMEQWKERDRKRKRGKKNRKDVSALRREQHRNLAAIKEVSNQISCHGVRSLDWLVDLRATSDCSCMCRFFDSVCHEGCCSLELIESVWGNCKLLA